MKKARKRDENKNFQQKNEKNSKNDAPVTGGVIAIKFHSTLPIVYAASTDGCVRVWDIRSGQCIDEFTGHEDMILSMDILEDQDRKESIILTGSDDGTAKVFVHSFFDFN